MPVASVVAAATLYAADECGAYGYVNADALDDAAVLAAAAVHVAAEAVLQRVQQATSYRH